MFFWCVARCLHSPLIPDRPDSPGLPGKPGGPSSPLKEAITTSISHLKLDACVSHTQNVRSHFMNNIIVFLFLLYYCVCGYFCVCQGL